MLTTATYNISIFKSLVIGILLFTTQMVHAQSSNFIAAEKLYNKGDFYSALTYYKAFLANEKASKTINKFTGYLSKHTGKKAVTANTKLVATMRLATAYRLLSDYQNAAIWYDSVKQIKGWEVYSEVDYWQGVSLRASGNIVKAKTTLTSYLNLPVDKCLYLKEAKKELADMDFAANELSLKKRRKSVVTKLSSPVNGDASNYAGVFVGDNLVFSSTRSDSNQINDKANPYQHHLYTTSLGKGSTINKLLFAAQANTEQGAASFTADGKTAFFTQWNIVNGKRVGAIYISYFKDTLWSKPVGLDTLVNKPNYISQQPFISTDGKYLFFASDRVGGKGKFDIWCAELDAAFAVKKVVNLPVSVNTADNEKTPFYISTSQTLVFSSDGWVGMGGYDLFSSKQTYNVFGKATNLGSPINTNKDDMYYFAKENTKEVIDDVLLSSDRDSKCCLELFSIHRLPAPVNTILGFVKNSDTKTPITELSFNWVANDRITVTTVNTAGNYQITVPDTASYLVKLSSANYADTSVAVSHIFSHPDDSVFYQDFYMRPLPPVVTTIQRDFILYFDFDKGSINDTAKLLLDSLASVLKAHPDWKLRIDGFTDAKGADGYNLKLSKKRATACFNYLKALTINEDRLVTSFFGEAMPVAPNTTDNGLDNPIGRQLNRRVIVTIIML
jgi:OOP family OmpA-OmpF porin